MSMSWRELNKQLQADRRSEMLREKRLRILKKAAEAALFILANAALGTILAFVFFYYFFA